MVNNFSICGAALSKMSLLLLFIYLKLIKSSLNNNNNILLPRRYIEHVRIQ